MGFYELEKVIVMWKAEKLTAEQALGQILQHLRELKAQLRELEKRLGEVERRQED